jgi:hypothetical protein
MGEKLLPCPFCGKAMQLRQALDVSDGGVDAVIHAEPTECGLYFDIGTADQCVSVTAAWNTRAQAADLARDEAPPTAQAEAVLRTPTDYAIEHAEYMAKGADRLIAAVNDLALAEQEHDEGIANESDVGAAGETLSEATRSLNGDIYEFRKRRARALVSAPPQALEVPQPWQPIETASKDWMVPLLLWVPMWRQKLAAALPLCGYWMGSFWVIVNADAAVQRVEPTHWMPIPAPPEVDQGAAK